MWGGRVRAAFTLVELLVVIAIISLLLSILLPCLQRAKQLVKRTVCASDLHQMLLAFIAYGRNYRGQLPYGTPAGPTHGRYGAWSVWSAQMATDGSSDEGGWYAEGLVYHLGYLTRPELMYCPAWKAPYYQMGNPLYGFQYHPDPATKKYISCGYHYRSSLDLDSGGQARAADLARDSGGTAIMCDGFVQAPGGGAGVDMHHGNGYNTCYLDGHDEFLFDTNRTVADAMCSNVAFAEQEMWWETFFDR